MDGDIADRLLVDHPIAAARHCGCVRCDAADLIDDLRAAGDALLDAMLRSQEGFLKDTEWDEAIEAWKELRLD